MIAFPAPFAERLLRAYYRQVFEEEGLVPPLPQVGWEEPREEPSVGGQPSKMETEQLMEVLRASGRSYRPMGVLKPKMPEPPPRSPHAHPAAE